MKTRNFWMGATIFGMIFLYGCGENGQIALNDEPVKLGHLKIQSLSISPSSVDTTEKDQVVTITMNLTDEIGVDLNADYSWYAPIANSSGEVVFTGTMQRVSGDAKNGIYVINTVIPKQSAAGTMRIARVELNDMAGKNKVYQYQDLVDIGLKQLVIENTTVDKTPPNIHNGVMISPAIFSTTNQDQTVVVSMAIQDNANTGNGSLSQLRLTNGQEFIDINNFVVVDPIWGPTYAYYEGSMVFPKDTPVGKWSV